MTAKMGRALGNGARTVFWGSVWGGMSICFAAALVSTPGRAQQIDIAAAKDHPAVHAAVSACKGDRARLCSFVFPGGGRIVRCLAEQPDRLSPPCRGAMQQARDALIAEGLAAPAAPAPR